MPSRNYERRDKKKSKKNKQQQKSSKFQTYSVPEYAKPNRYDYGFNAYALSQIHPHDVHEIARAVFGSTYYIPSTDM